MNIFNKITLEALKRNKTRTIVTIIGIVLSATMITCVTSLVTSLQYFMVETEMYNEGDWYGKASAVSGENLNELKNDSRVSSVKSAQILGYAELKDSLNPDKPFLYVLGAGKDFYESMPVRITSGRLPEKENEIILPSHLYSNGGIIYKIGDEVTLDLGFRMSESFYLWQNNSYLNTEDMKEDLGDEYVSETFQKTASVKYKVVGFYERTKLEDYGAPGFTAFTYSDCTAKNALYDAYYKTGKVSDAYTVMEASYLDGSSCDDNSNLLMYLGESSHSTFYRILYSLAAIIIGIIMIGSVSLIYNAFSISVSERTKQFGLLRSVGATKRQLRKSVIFEALTVSVIGIPIGIGVGLLGISATLKIAGGMFANLYNGAMPEELGLHINWLTIVAAAVIALITALVSVYVPSKRASKVTAIEAIRQTKDYKIKPKNLKSPKLIEKFFGIEGSIAHKQYKRNRSKYRTTIFSLIISIVLFISATSFCSYIAKSVDGVFGTANYDVSVTMEENTKKAEKYFTEISNLSGITEKAFVKGTSGMLLTDFDGIDAKFKSFIGDMDVRGVPVEIVTISDEEFKQYLKENNISEKGFFDTNSPKAVAAQNIKWINYDTERIENYTVFKNKKGNVAVYSYDGNKYAQLTDKEKEDAAGKSIDESPLYNEVNTEYIVTNSLPFGCDTLSGNCVVFVYPESVFNTFVKGDRMVASQMIFKADDHKTLTSEISELGITLGITSSEADVEDLAEAKEANRSLISIVRLFSYGFIILISLIAAANVFNTISTNINLRRREIAMLKSVGMSEKGVMKMMNYECAIYGIKSVLIGLPISFFVTVLIFLAVNSGIDVRFFIPWYAVLAAVVCAFIVVFSSMLYAMRKIKNENVVDALKNENI